MTQKSIQERRGVHRRTVLAGLGSATTAGLVAGTAAARGVRQSQTYALEQGGACRQVEPLAGDQPAADLYDYDVGDAADGLSDLQWEDVSIAFLYRERGGPLSLVVVHETSGDSDRDGGAASFAFSRLPVDGEWVVQDDNYGPGAHDVWDTDQESTDAGTVSHTVHWTWSKWGADGGVYEGLGSEFRVTVESAFNRNARLYGEHYEGTVDDWFFLSGSIDDPERIVMDLGQPVTIATGSCDGGEIVVGDDGA